MSKIACESPQVLNYCVEHGCPISAETMEVYNKNKAAREARAEELRRIAITELPRGGLTECFVLTSNSESNNSDSNSDASTQSDRWHK